jgi:DNA-binding Lrp family transcriptional regulator
MPVHVPLRLAILSELETVSKKNKNKWTSGTELERLAERLGFKPSNGARRARELAAQGSIERTETEDGYVQYRSN